VVNGEMWVYYSEKLKNYVKHERSDI